MLPPVCSFIKRLAFYLWGGLLLVCGNAFALTADPMTVAPGAVTALTYNTWGASGGCHIYDTFDWSAVVSNVPGGTGTVSIIPSRVGANTYVLRCGTTQMEDSVTVVVDESLDPPAPPTTPPTISFTISPSTITTVQTSTLSWSVQGASTCTASGSWAGEKSKISGFETLSGLAVGSYSYTLTCENAIGTGEPKTVTLEVQPVPPVQITSFTIHSGTTLLGTSGTILSGSAASLKWATVNAVSCTRSGNWSGSTTTSNSSGLSLSPAIRTTLGNYSFTLACTGADGSTDSKTVTLTVTGVPEITLLGLVSLNQVPFPWWNDGDVFVLPQGASVGIDRVSKNTTSCELHVGDSPDNLINLAGQYVFSNPGQQNIVYTCNGQAGQGQVSRTLPVRVAPKPSIASFAANPGTISEGESTTLSWATQNASSCTVNGSPVGDVNGSLSVSPSFGEEGYVEYELSCRWTDGFEDRACLPEQVALGCTKLALTKLKASVNKNGGLSGRYFGAFDLLMAQAPRPGESGLPLSAGRRLKEDGSNEPYIVLGHNQPGSFWMWDFDELNAHGTGKIYLGGSNLLAILTATPPMRLFSPGRLRIDGQHYPDAQPPLEDHIGTFVDRGDGTYDVRFNYQIFMGNPASYPLIKLANRMRVTLDEQGVLKIATLDYTEAGPPSDTPDGIPGMRSPMAGEIGIDGGIAVTGDYFPARVSPQFYSKQMLKVNMSDLGANGLPRVVNDALGLDNTLVDNDGDGIADALEIGDNLALPLSTQSVLGAAFRDNVFDVLKPTQFINPPHIVGLIPLGSGERVVVYSENPALLAIDQGGTGYIGVRHQQINPGLLGQPWDYWYFDSPPPVLPSSHPDNSNALSYELGSLVFRAVYSNKTNPSPNHTYSIYFNQGVPEGLLLIQLEPGIYQNNNVINPVVQADGHTVRFNLFQHGQDTSTGGPTTVVLAHTGTPRIFAEGNKFNKDEPGYQALLTQATAWNAPTPPAPDPVSITNFAPSSATITLGASTQLLWQAANADNCTLKQGDNILYLASLLTGNYEVTPDSVGTYTYELVCARGSDSVSHTTTVQVQQAGGGSGGTGTPPPDPNLITGTWTGSFSLTMRTAPEGMVLGNSHDNAWTWNFDEGWAEFAQGMLSVGFPFHVQDVGNASASHDRAYFTKNGNGTYTLYYGYQIYNPNVGNPRTDITTTFSVTRNGNQLCVVTLDTDNDGVPGIQVPGVFPLTVSPDFVGAVAQNGSADPGLCGAGTDPGTGPGTDLIGLFAASSASVGPGQSFTLTWQAVRATSCTASGAWSGGKGTAGTESLVAPATAGTHTYTLACTGSSGSMSRSVTVQVGTGTGTPAETVTGEVADLVVGSGKTVQNNGTLVNPTNHGTIQGGTVAGTVQNDGTLADVTLAAGTTVSGGTLRGDLQGSGTVTNAIVDASSLSPDVSLGAGVRITAATAHNVPGLDLSAAVRGQDGLLDPTAPLLIAEEGAAPLTLGDLARRGIDSLFANGATHADAGAGMLVLSNSAALPGKVVPVAPAAVRTTDQPDGTALDPNGNLVVTSGGIQTTYVPVPLDPQALSNGLQVAAATVTEESADGRLLVRIGGTTFSVRVGLLATQAGEGRRTRASGGATFATAGSLADPAGYRIVAHYPDGSSQDLIPYLHDLAGFAAHIAAAGWTHAIDAVSGRITLKNAAGTVVAQGMPDYQIAPATGTPGIASAGDRNGDGLDDWLFNTGQGSQIIYNLGLPPVDPDALAGTWTGRFTLTMRTAPQGVVLGDSRDNAWTWNFDEGWAELAQGMLSVGFPFHVQDLGNASASHDRAYFTKNADGTYTLRHGYQIYNPYVGNPRIDMTTTVRITREGSQLRIVTLDPDGDGVAGIQVPGVFPLTVSPDFVGTLAQDGSADPDPGTGDPGTSPGTDLIGAFVASPTGVGLGQTATLTWQAVRATSCTASGAWSGAKATAGTESVTPATAGAQTYTLTCTAGSETMSRSVTVQVDAGGGTTNPTDPADPSGPGTTGLTGLYVGEHLITMRGCPGACAAGQEVVLGTGVKNAPWVWNFDTRTVLITGTTLSVGFNYEVQSLGNQGTGDARLTAGFTDNGDGTYTLHHGFQIYNPNVGNPRADTTTKFQISRDSANPNRIVIRTLDDEPGHSPDGIPGTQIVGVFPLTVQPDFRGDARREGGSSAGDGIPDQVKEALGLNPDAANGDTDGDGIPDATEIGPDPANPLDSDGDGVIDALEPGAAAQDARRIAGLALLGGQPGRVQEGTPLSGTTVDVQAGNGWQFTGAGTGLMQLAAADDAGAMPETTLGDAGLDYRHGYVQVRLSGSGPATLRLTYAAALPAANKLLVYATRRVEGRERYALMSKSDYRRIDDHTLEVAVQDDGAYDLDPSPGVLRTGVAPVANTLGGY